MRKPIAAVTVRSVLASLFWLIAATPAWAIDRAPGAQTSQGWLSTVALFVFIIAVVVGCFMSPRRTHLD